jgi:hypothetical protein
MGTHYERCDGRGLTACAGCLRNVDNPPAPDVHGDQCRSWKGARAEVRPAMRAPLQRVNGRGVL